MDAVGSNKTMATDCCGRLKAMSNRVLCWVGVSQGSYIIRPAGFQGLCIRGVGEGGEGGRGGLGYETKYLHVKVDMDISSFLPLRRKNKEIAVSK